MNFRRHSECEYIFDEVKRCFQTGCTDQLTIEEIISKTKNALQPGRKSPLLTVESLYKFLKHLPENYELSGGGSDIRTVVVHFRPLLHRPACLMSDDSCTTEALAPANCQIKETKKMVKRQFSGEVSQELLIEACALIMNAFIALGRNSVPLLQLRKFLNNDHVLSHYLTFSELPNELCYHILRDQSSLDQFLLERPYLFVKTGNYSYSMFDMQTTSLLVYLNNTVWCNGNAVPITSLLNVAIQIDGSLNDAAELESFLARHGRLFKIEDGVVKVHRKICGFQRTCELLERLG
ncbi:hypothetical protein M514_10891 [Trichuris suis]|uniref:Uncharacterized protein n=1 Tax=Trichuris suis TaxID=68888 RepID=A0A085LTF2_9BILA|nr:hypothetical protein M513_10891 [Trichuris suis]KFD69786.1 hypothetical protein M514_10891 [Trichuris suis]KHJ44775.1 hypothetical protein D918_05013 [Trichuris suis]